MIAIAALAGCSGGEAVDPEQVVRTALERKALLDRPVGPTDVEVASLGFNDAVLNQRQVAIDAGTHRDVLRALAGVPGDRGESGLVGLARDLEFGEAEGGVTPADDGERLDAVTGRIEAGDLVAALRRSGAEEAGLEAVGGVDRNLVRADFALYTLGPDRDFRGLDLVLVQDDPGNSLPPSRIRFRLAATGQ